jgi:hypothetical protein
MKRHPFYVHFLITTLDRSYPRSNLPEVRSLVDRRVILASDRLPFLVWQLLKAFSGKECKHLLKLLDQLVQPVLTLTSRTLKLKKSRLSRLQTWFAAKKYRHIPKTIGIDDFAESFCCQHF